MLSSSRSACDLRIAEDGEYLIGLPEQSLDLLPAPAAPQRLPRTIGMSAALMHSHGVRHSVRVKPKGRGLVHETVSGKALDRAMEIAWRLSSHTPESACLHQASRPQRHRDASRAGTSARTKPLLKLCISERWTARGCVPMRREKITSPSRSFEI